jgi:hypothetical protein
MCSDSIEDNVSQIKTEAYRLSEKSLESDVAASFSADQRAMSFCGIVVAAAAILTGLFDPGSPNFGLLLSALILAISAGFAGFSARPVTFYFPGARFDDFESDFDQNIEYVIVIDQLARFNDKHSRFNRKILESNANIFGKSYILAIFGISIAILSQVLTIDAISGICAYGE